MSNEENNGLATTVPANRLEFYQQVELEIKSKAQLKGLTQGQQELIDTINSSIITLATGPAGTGKTFIPVVRGLELLKEQNTTFKKMIITRPAVECGDEMGFLPGDDKEKIEPYMRPIMDVLEDVLGISEAKTYIASNIIEFCALAYMRGRSINNAIMILDEAQNAKWNQLLMFMTRIGRDSKIIITGDEDQGDRVSDAFKTAVKRNEMPPYIDGINVVRLTERDIVRNDIIKKIIKKMGTFEDGYNTFRK